MTANQQAPQGPVITLQMDEQAVDTIMRGLSKLPLEETYHLFNGIGQAKEAQIRQYKEAQQEPGTEEDQATGTEETKSDVSPTVPEEEKTKVE